MKYCKLITCCLLLWAMQAFAQMTTRGLYGNNLTSLYHVRSVTQDKNGFIWMGASNGLFRYDGYQYQKIQENNNPLLFPDESVTRIENWGDRYLWMVLRGGMHACYDIDNGRFVSWSGDDTNKEPYQNLTITDESHLWLYDRSQGCRHIFTQQDGQLGWRDYTVADKTLPSNNIRFILQDPTGRTWIGSDKGLTAVSKSQGKSRTVVQKKDFVCGQVANDGTCYFLTRQGDIFRTESNAVVAEYHHKAPGHTVRNVAYEPGGLVITTSGPTLHYDLKQHVLAVHPSIRIQQAQLVTDNHGNKVVFDQDGTDLWYFTPGNTYHLRDIYSKALTQQHDRGRFKFIEGAGGKIWISTYGNGLHSYDTKTGVTTHYASGSGQQALTRSEYLLNIFEDKQGLLWVCHENEGVSIVSDTKQQASLWFFTTPADQGHANNIRLIQPVKGQILVGNRLNNLCTVDEQLHNTGSANPFGDDVVAAETDHQGRVWIGTRKKGVFVDGQPLESVTKGKVSDILCDRQGRVWISMFDNGIDMVSTGQNGSMTVRTFFKGAHAISQPRSMLQDHRGYIWLCSSNGVYRFMPEELIRDEQAYVRVNASGGNKNSDEVHCIYEDSHHRIWAGTTGYGLVCLDSVGNVVRRLTAKDGLPNDRIESIVEDKHGCIWAGTGYGLAKYADDKEQVNSFFLSDHILGLMYTEGCALSLPDGRLVMGTLHGMQVFDPDSIKPAPSLFNTAITNVYVNGVSLQDMGYSSPAIAAQRGGDRLTLSHDENSLTFYFSDFEYIGNENVKYSYRLDSYDQDWSKPQDINFTTYKNLRPGTYTLHVRSFNAHGMPNEHEATLQFVIRQPWWNTWWAWMIYLVVVAAIAWAIWRNWKQISELHTRIKVEKQLTEYKLRFFTNISHEFRTPLTIIRGAMEHIDKLETIPGDMKQPVSSMSKSVSRMMRLIDELLEFRKMQNDKLQLALEETDVIAFVKNIYQTFSQTAENKHIDYTFMTFARQYNMFIDKGFVDKIVYNLLSNAFKYTMSRHEVNLHIGMQEDTRSLVITVKDTGIGIPKEKQADLFKRFNQSVYSQNSIGIGLHLVSELVRVHHGSIAFAENPAGGSIFTVTLPTDESVYERSDFLVADNEVLREENEQQGDGIPANYQEMMPEPMNNCLVLVVEDDTDVREYLLRELGRYFVTDYAANGSEALEKVQGERPDLIISDVMMPVMDGFKLTEKLRGNPQTADIPIILLTALTGEEKMIKGIESGADAYIEKPFSVPVLIAKCRQLMEQRMRLRTQYAKEVVDRATPEILTDDQDKRFRDHLDSWLANHYQDSKLDIDSFAESMGYGRTTFYKRVKKITGKTPNEYIKERRMEHAIELLRDDHLTIAEVSYQIGMEDPFYFSKLFKNYFGISPSQYRKGEKPKQNM